MNDQAHQAAMTNEGIAAADRVIAPKTPPRGRLATHRVGGWHAGDSVAWPSWPCEAGTRPPSPTSRKLPFGKTWPLLTHVPPTALAWANSRPSRTLPFFRGRRAVIEEPGSVRAAENVTTFHAGRRPIVIELDPCGRPRVVPQVPF
jgi:hypothetical protein